MKRVIDYSLNGKKYAIVWNTTLAIDFSENNNGLHDTVDSMVAGDESAMRSTITLGASVMAAGWRFVNLCGIDGYAEPPAAADLADMMDMEDLSRLTTAIMAAIGAEPAVEVEAEKGKKGKTTQRKG